MTAPPHTQPLLSLCEIKSPAFQSGPDGNLEALQATDNFCIASDQNR